MKLPAVLDGCNLSVIIVSWNAVAHLRKCLASIEETTHAADLEVIVVDNASIDGSPEMVKQEFPGVRLLEAGENLGFATANNLGLQHSHGRYVCLINSDVVLHKDCLQRLMIFMDEHADVGLAGPRLLNPDNSLQASCRVQPTLFNHLARALFLNTSLADPAYKADEVENVEVIAGAFWIARRSAVEEIGGLDENFFFYGEDLDWCLRFRRAGWRISFYPHAVATHFGGASAANNAARFSAELQQARLRLWEKYHGRASTILYLKIDLLYHGLRLLVAGLRGGSDRVNTLRFAERRAAHIASLRWVWNMLRAKLSASVRMA